MDQAHSQPTIQPTSTSIHCNPILDGWEGFQILVPSYLIWSPIGQARAASLKEGDRSLCLNRIHQLTILISGISVGISLVNMSRY